MRRPVIRPCYTDGVTPPRLRQLGPSDRALVENLWQCYQHDLSEFRGNLPGPDGRYRADRVTLYLGSPDHTAFLIETDDSPAGFVMTRKGDDSGHVLGEFFVVRPMRRRGLGRTVATDVISRHPGRWEIAFQEANARAARFWTGIARELAGTEWAVAPRQAPDRPDAPPDLWLTFEV